MTLIEKFQPRKTIWIVAVLFYVGLPVPGIHAETFSEAPHWAFQPLYPVTLPTVSGTISSGWDKHPIDRLVLAKLQAEGLKPVEQTSKRKLIRRVYLDLIGLPPTPEEMEACLADDSVDAYQKLIDRLLSSRHYGERWGRHWLDIVRYADTAGDNSDCPVPEMYRYRDYVINAFNNDKPYDEFLLEQLAGDLLANDNPHERLAEKVIATGYIALAKRFGNRPYQYRHVEIGDLIDCTGRGFLALTMGCARCHDHKFDPMTADDYYALYGIFDSTTYSFSGAEATKDRLHLVSTLYPHEEYLARKAKYNEQAQPLAKEILELEGVNPLTTTILESNKAISLLEKQIQQNKDTGKDTSQLEQKLAKFVAEKDKAEGELHAKLKPLKASLAKIDEAYAPLMQTVAFAASVGKAADAPLQQMGDPDLPGKIIKRGVPKFLAGDQPLLIPEETSGRLEFARWLTKPGTVAEGLTSRVMVNRIWQHHFGQAIVLTPSNFGLNGQSPSQPELLDWLATEFVKRGWSIKAIHRLIMLSKTYRLSSQHDPHNYATDPDNKWLWHYNRHRLDAEVIRDAMLVISGKLDRTRPGAHPFPPIREWRFSQHKPFKAVYPSQHRSVYLMTQRNQRHPYLAIFDGPDTNLSTGMRTRSILPQQALYLMNNPFVKEQAKAFAVQLIDWSSVTDERIERAHQSAWGRPATPAEIDKGIAYIQHYQQQLQHEDVPNDQWEAVTWTSYAKLMLIANEFLHVE